MIRLVRVTLNIDDLMARRLREEASRRDTTSSALVEAGLRLVLPAADIAARESGGLRPLPSWNSGGFRVDIADRDALYRLMEEGD